MSESLNDWTTFLVDGPGVDIAHVDFAKAFDRFSLQKSLVKLTEVGIHPRIIAWIKSFLADRTFSVRVNSACSQPRSALSGAPQGGVFSPILFKTDNYELPKLVTDNGVRCTDFTGDFKLYISVSSASEKEKLQKAPNGISKWSLEWNLPKSKEKTKVLRFGQPTVDSKCTPGDYEVQQEEEITDLGFLIRSDLCFDVHCKKIAKKRQS